MASSDAARLTRLSIFLGQVLGGKRGIKNAADTNRFLEAICNEQDHQRCIERLLGSSPALNALQSGLRFDVTNGFLNQKLPAFLLYVSTAAVKELCNGQVLKKLLMIIVDPPTLWVALVGAAKGRVLEGDALLAFAWLLSELVLLPSLHESGVLADAEYVTTSGLFLESASHEIRTYGHKIKHVLNTRCVSVAFDQGSTAGGRHDNDFEDFRQVAIFPTADEFLSTEKPFYRPAEAIVGAKPDHRVAMHLDNQFRLLREDMLAELREDLQAATGKKRSRRPAFVLTRLSVVGLFCGEEKKRRPASLEVRCEHGLEPLLHRPPNERKKFLSDNRNFLKHQSFGCIIQEDNIVAFATLDRNEDALLKDPPVVVLHILGDEASKKALLALKLRSDLRFILVDTPIFAYEPVLKCLQERVDLPLAEEMLHSVAEHPIRPQSLIPDSVITAMNNSKNNNIKDILDTKNDIRLDPSQLASLLQGLANPLSLIQGPPGTGKSFIGALLAKAFHKHTKETILVICYTNHALDQFLEELLDIGIPNDHIVRLGAKSTPRTASLNLSEQKFSYKNSQAVWSIINQLNTEAGDLHQSMKEDFKTYATFSAHWKDVMEYLEFSEEYGSFYEALQTPDKEDGMTKVNSQGKSVGPGYLYGRWCGGFSAGVFAGDVAPEHQECWKLSKAQRQTYIDRWTNDLLQERVNNITGSVQRFNSLQGQLDEAWNEKTRAILKQKRVIGCTTTAAAKYVRDLRSASTGIVLVEEAGEILESHIITALSPNSKRLALIGDHKQLRPKVKNYALTVERGDGYDLNRSLFERLVLGGYPHTTLNNQHRMCPEISSLVRHLTYPDLLDAEKTLNRPPPRGLQGRVTFFNHNQPEVQFGQIADRLDEGAKASKRNLFEADIVLKVVRYLAQQGYGTDRIVILTPYLGQLHLLRDQLSKENDPVLNDLDSHDLLRAGLISQASAQLSKRPIRISTIDNYQGEESDIVVASLTRSNDLGEIGFMIAPERLNVLLSRAREALIMIGNAETFIKSRKGKETWIPLFDKLRKNSQLHDGLPVKCEQHPQTLALLRSKEDFDTECPDGGCAQPCGARLNCGSHDCLQRCHQLYDHSKMECRAIVESVCPRSHRLTRPCFKSKTPCRKCEAEDEEKERIKRRDHKLDMQRESRQKVYMQQLQEVQDEIAHERRILRGRAEQNDQERSLEQYRQDLENLRRRPGRSQKVKATRQPPSTNRNPPSTTEGGGDSACQECSERSPSEGPKGSNDGELSPGEEWSNQKEYEDAHNEALDSLMEMIGLEDVKSAFLSIKSRVDTAVRQGIGLKTDRFGATLLGNPGTGKTTVARLYGKFLTSVGALPGSFFVESTGSRLANDGVSGCKKHLEDIQNNGGGVLFIDEAYQLTSGHNYGGAQVLDFLLAEVENLTGKVVFVLAGYNKQMESFFAHNPGLPSRFPNELQFKDYEDKELLDILVSKIDKKYDARMELEDGSRGLYTRIVASRIGRGRGREGFGNARAVENVCQKISERQANRIRKERRAKITTNDMLLTKEDLIGPEPSEALKSCKAWTELEKLTGLKVVKESVQALVASIEYNYTRELEEKPLVEYSLNRVFLGSPGTGKTSVAKIYGKILAHIGLLSNGEVVVKNPSDFVGSVLGGSEQNTKGILASTAGKVLVIDEAYGLLGGSTEGGGPQSDPYKQAVIDTIVAEVQSTPGEDRCVLLLGYKEQMEDMLQKANPGLARRFPLDSAFLFEDFTDEELGTILDMKLKQQGFAATDQGRKVAMDVLRRSRNRPHFGNAGEIDILLNAAKTRHQKDRGRGSKAKNAATLEARHFDEDFDRGERAETNVKALFRDTVGFEEIVSQLEGYQQTTKNMKSVDMDPREQLPFNFLFRGPPGTGKTTTARKMGKVYYDMGFLATAEVIEASATELVGQYVGQTGPKAHKLLERALGKILFIDEAYRLAEGHFAKEAMDEIVDSITKPKFAQKLIIILAGYDADINRLMSINPGLTSRFPETLTFRSLSPEECRNLLTKQLEGSKHKLAIKKRNMDISVLESPDLTFLQHLLDRFDALSTLPSWANARDVQTIAKSIFNKLIKSFDGSPKGLIVDEATILGEIDSMIMERKHRGSHAPPELNLSGLSSHAPMAPQFAQPPASTTSARSTAACIDRAEAPQPQEEASAVVPPPDDVFRDAGVSQEIWDRLAQDKRVDEAKEKDYDRLVKEEAALQAKIAKAAAHVEAAATALDQNGVTTSQPPMNPEAKHEHEQARLENLEAKRRHEEERLKREHERRVYEEELARLRKIKAAEAERRKKEREAQQKLKQMGVCVAGFRWIKQAAGYRCAGGSHFVSDAQLGL